MQNISAPFLMQVPPFRESFLKVLEYTDFLFGNETELRELAKALQFGTDDCSDIARKVSQMVAWDALP